MEGGRSSDSWTGAPHEDAASGRRRKLESHALRMIPSHGRARSASRRARTARGRPPARRFVPLPTRRARRVDPRWPRRPAEDTRRGGLRSVDQRTLRRAEVHVRERREVHGDDPQQLGIPAGGDQPICVALAEPAVRLLHGTPVGNEVHERIGLRRTVNPRHDLHHVGHPREPIDVDSPRGDVAGVRLGGCALHARHAEPARPLRRRRQDRPGAARRSARLPRRHRSTIPRSLAAARPTIPACGGPPESGTVLRWNGTGRRRWPRPQAVVSSSTSPRRSWTASTRTGRESPARPKDPASAGATRTCSSATGASGSSSRAGARTDAPADT